MQSQPILYEYSISGLRAKDIVSRFECKCVCLLLRVHATMFALYLCSKNVDAYRCVKSNMWVSEWVRDRNEGKLWRCFDYSDINIQQICCAGLCVFLIVLVWCVHVNYVKPFRLQYFLCVIQVRRVYDALGQNKKNLIGK